MKAAALVMGVIVLLLAARDFVGGADNLDQQLKERLNSYPLKHDQHRGLVESVECAEDEAFKDAVDRSFYDCLVRYEDGFVEPWCATGMTKANGATGLEGTTCSEFESGSAKLAR